jgi:hypothetical protein
MYEDESGSRTPILIGLGVLFVGALVGAYFLFARKPEVMKAPTGYTPYVSADKTFACDSPNGWQRRESAGGGIMSGVVFTQGKAKIDINSDLQGSLMGDIARSSNSQIDGISGMLPPGMTANTPAPRPPVEKLHMSTTNGLKNKFTDFKEGQMHEVPNMPLGDARVSEWTGDAGFMAGGKIHGYRMTILNNDRRTVVISYCPESSWAALKPAFQKVAGSLKPGGGG